MISTTADDNDNCDNDNNIMITLMMTITVMNEMTQIMNMEEVGQSAEPFLRNYITNFSLKGQLRYLDDSGHYQEG